MSPLLATAPSSSDVPLWASLLVGIGIGTIVSALVAVLGQYWQRGHELRIEEIRDLQRLRDARLERLREDLRDVVGSAFDFMEAMYLLREVRANSTPENLALVTRALARYASSTERLYMTRSRLMLDADAPRVMQALPNLTNVLEGVSRAASDYQQLSERSTEQRVAFIVRIAGELQGTADKVPDLFEQAQQLLQQVEQQPLYQLPRWWSPQRRGTAVRP